MSTVPSAAVAAVAAAEGARRAHEDGGACQNDRIWQHLHLARLDHAENPESSRRKAGLKRISVVSTAWLHRETAGAIRVSGHQHDQHQHQHQHDQQQYQQQNPRGHRLAGGTVDEGSEDTSGLASLGGLSAMCPSRQTVVTWRRMRRNFFLATHLRSTGRPTFMRRKVLHKQQPELREPAAPASSSEFRSVRRGHGSGGSAWALPDPSHLWKTTWPRSCICVKCGHFASMGENFLGCLICDQVAHKSCQSREEKVYHEHLRDVVAWVIESSARLRDAPVLRPPDEDHHDHDDRHHDDEVPTEWVVPSRWVCHDCLEALSFAP